MSVSGMLPDTNDLDFSDTTTLIVTIILALWFLAGFIVGIIAFTKSPSYVFGGEMGRLGHLVFAFILAPIELFLGSVEIHYSKA